MRLDEDNAGSLITLNPLDSSLSRTYRPSTDFGVGSHQVYTGFLLLPFTDENNQAFLLPFTGGNDQAFSCYPSLVKMTKLSPVTLHWWK